MEPEPHSFRSPRLIGTGRTALIVHPRKPFRQAAEMVLSGQNFRVLAVQSAEEALALAEKGGRIDVLLAGEELRGTKGTALATTLAKTHTKMQTFLLTSKLPPDMAERDTQTIGRAMESRVTIIDEQDLDAQKGETFLALLRDKLSPAPGR